MVFCKRLRLRCWSVSEPHKLFNPNYRDHNSFYWIEGWSGGCPINNFWLNQRVVGSSPVNYTTTRCFYITKPVSLLAKGERDYKTISSFTRTHGSRVRAT